jgi:hypothetical protein
MPTLLDYAKRYAQLGLPVFPCHPRGKAPMTPNGLLDATTDLAQIEKWWTANPRANIACAIPADLLVIDFDSDEALQRAHYTDRELPETVWARTSRGRHYWYRTQVQGLRNGKLLEDVDLKCKGGYVLLPPSIHPSGVEYSWGSPPPHFSDVPEWVLREAATRTGTVREVVSVDRIFQGLPSGERNSELFRYACRLRQKGVELTEAQVLVVEAAARCTPPLPQWEALNIVESAWRYERGSDRVKDVEIISIGDLKKREYPPVSWIIKDLIPEGLIVLAASPKIGKSWLAMQLCFALGTGGKFLRHFKASYGKSLYMDLEQPARRTQSRVLAMPGSPDENVDFVHRWPTYADGGFKKLDQYLAENPDVRLVVVDVLAKLVGKKPSGGGNAYDMEYDIYGELKSITDAHQVTTIAIHHDNKTLAEDKFDRISGSRALLAVADAALVLTRKRGESAGELFAAGREVEDQTIDLAFDHQQKSWRYTGMLSTSVVAETQSWRSAAGHLIDEVSDEWKEIENELVPV